MGLMEVSREELHKLVWEIPMARLCERFGLSGNGLAKICRRLDVPYPPRGYWAKVAAGKQVKPEALPKAKDGTPGLARINHKTSQPADEVLPHMQSALSAAMEQVGTVKVAARLHEPHPVIAAWLAEHARQVELAGRSRDRWSGGYTPSTPSPMERRRQRLLDAVFKALEKRGARAGQNERGELYVEVSGERLPIELREKFKQVRRPLTTEELRWGGNKTGTRQELQPTGFFLFTIKRHLPGNLRKEWLEREDAPLDGQLAAIVSTCLVAGPILADESRRREEEARRAEEERARRKQDRNQWRRFSELAKAWDEVETSRRFLQAIRELGFLEEHLIDGKPISEWLDWAEQKLTAANPIERGILGIFGDVASVKPWTYHD